MIDAVAANVAQGNAKIATDGAQLCTDGAGDAAAGAFADPFTLTPIYVRRPEAEEKYEQAQAARGDAS